MGETSNTGSRVLLNSIASNGIFINLNRKCSCDPFKKAEIDEAEFRNIYYPCFNSTIVYSYRWEQFSKLFSVA